MNSTETKFDKKINGIRYIVYSFKVGNETFTTMRSSIPINGLTVDSIEYSETTQTFQMVDFVNIWGRTIKIMFSVGLNMKIKGIIYNDFEDTYEAITYEPDPDLAISDITEKAYQQYLKRLQDRLTKKFASKEAEFHELNNEIIELSNKEDTVSLSLTTNNNQ